MTRSLATLPWVEARTIKADRSSRSVTFGLNDLSGYSLEKLESALGARYQKNMKVVSGPTKVESASSTATQ